MEKQRTASPVQLGGKPILQQKVSGMSQSSGTGSGNGSIFKVRVPRNLAKKYSVMRFQSTKVDISSISKAQMSRQTDTLEEKESENLPSFGAGSEFGRERREEARKKRRGFVTQPKDPEAAPWNLKIGGKSGRRFTGRKEAGINENSSYYVLTQCEDGAFEAVPVSNWCNFTAAIKYQTLTMDEAEEEFGRREKTLNYFTLMVKKRLQDKEDSEEGDENNLEKTSKIASRTANLIIHDDDRDLSLSEEEGDDDDDDENQGTNKNKEDKQGNKDKNKVGQKRQQKKKKDSDADSDASSEEDGYLDSKEVDYLSDSSSSSEEAVKTVEVSKPKAEDDLNAEETSSEDEDELTQEGHELKDMLERDEGRESWDEEDEDPDQDEVKGTSALFLQGDKKRKKKSGSGSSTSSNSRSSTPTAAIDSAANTIAAAVSKLSQDRPGTPSKSKKRPASAAKKGTPGEEGSPASKKPRVSPAPSSVGGGSRTSTPTPTGIEEGPQGITEEAVRRYLTRKPMTSKDLLQKFKSKRTGLSNDETVKKIAAIVRKLQPEQKTIKGKLYLSLKQTN